MATSGVLAAPRGGVRRPVGVMGAAARPAQRQRTRASGRAAEGERLTAEWRGPELMAQPERWMLTLSEEHIRELDGVVERSRDLRLTETTASDFEMPTFARELRRVKSELLMGGPGIALLRGVPVDRYTVEETVRAYWAMMVSLGDVDPVPQNAKGHMLGHVYDLGGDASDPNTRIFTTSAAQPMHTDSADIVGLLCLAEAVSGGESQVVSSTAVYREVQRRAPELARELTRPFVWSRKGEVPAGCEPWFAVPVFSEMGGNVCSIHDRSFIDAAQASFAREGGPVEPLTESQEAALRLADELAWSDELRLDMKLQPGDVQLLHNHQIWHARSAYEDDAEDGRRRHLMRMWLSVRDGWELPPAYAARYGTIEVGSVRGGIRTPGDVKDSVPLHPC